MQGHKVTRRSRIWIDKKWALTSKQLRLMGDEPIKIEIAFQQPPRRAIEELKPRARLAAVAGFHRARADVLEKKYELRVLARESDAYVGAVVAAARIPALARESGVQSVRIVAAPRRHRQA